MISDFSDHLAIEAAIESVETTLSIAAGQRKEFIDTLGEMGYLPCEKDNVLSVTTFRKKRDNLVTQIHISEVRNPSSSPEDDFCFIHKKIYTLINNEGKEVQHREGGLPSLISYHMNNTVHIMSFRRNGVPVEQASFDGLFLDNLNFIERQKSKVSFYFFMRERCIARLTILKNSKRSIQNLVYLINGREYSISDISKVIPSIKSLPLQEKIDLNKTRPEIVNLFEMLTV